MAWGDGRTADELAATLDLAPTQIKPWLKRAVPEAGLLGLGRPRRYLRRRDLFEGTAEARP